MNPNGKLKWSTDLNAAAHRFEGRLIDAILAYLVAGDGAESVSYVHRGLQQWDGWEGLGRLADFETLVERLGFVVRHGKNNRGQSRREITI